LLGLLVGVVALLSPWGWGQATGSEDGLRNEVLPGDESSRPPPPTPPAA